jgi:hypothetical protein
MMVFVTVMEHDFGVTQELNHFTYFSGIAQLKKSAVEVITILSQIREYITERTGIE